MMVPLVEMVPFEFGTPELILTILPVVIILAILGPRLLRELRK